MARTSKDKDQRIKELEECIDTLKLPAIVGYIQNILNEEKGKEKDMNKIEKATKSLFDEVWQKKWFQGIGTDHPFQTTIFLYVKNKHQEQNVFKDGFEGFPVKILEVGVIRP